jgi:hypothetical protein
MNPSILAVIRYTLMFLVPAAAYADSAQWDLDPISGDWNTAANWTPNGVPNSPADIATFGLSHTTDVSISADTEVNGITFTSAATNPYGITASPGLTLTISGLGILNNSGITQNFVTGVDGAGNYGQIVLTNNAIAVNGTFTNNGAAVSLAGGGSTLLFNSTAAYSTFTNNGATASGAGGGFTNFSFSTVANGTFTNNGATVSGSGAGSTLVNNSTAVNSTFTNNGGTVSGASGGLTEFFSSSAGNSGFTNNGGAVSGAHGGATNFFGSSTAGNASIENAGDASDERGGSTAFFNRSTAGSANISNNGALLNS